ncbi:Seh1p SCDLUD_001036 [Saccharomycodes ludwigii]|nr:hypothetical protein SCDLUD_001036 [Saccharomycodes ludwigii]KAH3903401.1 hypothetical protein SCDLUD_001036 [Saccharomycodes ludwigii]
MIPFISGHEDLIHDVAYDFYGRHLATCSSDQHVKVFRLDKETNEWILSDSWKAHDSSIVSLDWASPEFGRLIVTASYDKKIKIWEEDPDIPEGSGKRWINVTTLNDSIGPLFSVKFAPSHFGLRIGCIGNDGILRIYDALEPSDLKSWTITSELKVLATPPASHLQSDFELVWCPSRFYQETIVCCALDQGLIYQRNKEGKLFLAATLPGHKGLIRSVSWAPSIGRTYQLVATGCKDGNVRIFKITDHNKYIASNYSGNGDNEANNSTIAVELIAEKDDHKGEVWSVSWNLTGTVLSSAGDDGKVRLWKSSYSDEFQ